MAITEFYDDLSHLDDIDWTVMDLIYWNDTPENSDRKRRRQAEFLVYEFFPWECINSIGVYDDKIQQRVMSIVEQNEKKVVVKIQKDWYY